MRLRIDPWGVEMGLAYRGDDVTSEGHSEVVLDVEYDRWQPLRPRPSEQPYEQLLFLDGGRRVEARVWLEPDAGGAAFGILGSYGVGVVACDLRSSRPAALVALDIGRLCAIGSGHSVPDITIPAGRDSRIGALAYRTVAVPSTDPDAVVRKLQLTMLEAESAMALRHSAHHGALLICDGPRPRIGAAARVVGYLKSIHALRIGEAELAVVRSLEAGQRSPLFLLRGAASEHDSFQCFLRLRDPRPWLYSLAAVVRLQVYAGPAPERTLPEAVRLVDILTEVLPRFASRAHQDPRAPQQLLPVRALERELARRMGDAQLVRRRITDYLAQAEA